MTQNLTLHYKRVMYLLEPSEVARTAAGNRVLVSEADDGNAVIEYKGTALPARAFEKDRRVSEGFGAGKRRLDPGIVIIARYSAAMASSAGSLKLGHAQGADRFFLLERPIGGGDVVQICASGGWITGRFEWDRAQGRAPTFYFSIELDGGGVAQLEFPIPERALLRWP